ncbi:MAG TPA: MerR family transcriptional regulator [Pseudonocardiaceae bacterium]|nr:MerR family transcriptional regulator [Pseudonocardiaceae bacterium]
MTKGTSWSVGELAAATAVTVRALHHYDRIGLLTPTRRTSAGHRRYDEHDVRRLYRIQSMRSLGLPLSEIAAVLDSSEAADLRELLRTQLRGLDERATRLAEIRGRVAGLLTLLDADRMPEAEHFLLTMELMSMYETYFTEDQRTRLADRRAELGEEEVEAAREEWAAVAEELLPHAEAATPMDDPAVVALIRRWNAIGARMQPPDDEGETAEAARRMWRDNSSELATRLPWSADQLTKLVAYVQEARNDK